MIGKANWKRVIAILLMLTLVMGNFTPYLGGVVPWLSSVTMADAAVENLSGSNNGKTEGKPFIFLSENAQCTKAELFNFLVERGMKNGWVEAGLIDDYYSIIYENETLSNKSSGTLSFNHGQVYPVTQKKVSNFIQESTSLYYFMPKAYYNISFNISSSSSALPDVSDIVFTHGEKEDCDSTYVINRFMEDDISFSINVPKQLGTAIKVTLEGAEISAQEFDEYWTYVVNPSKSGILTIQYVDIEQVEVTTSSNKYGSVSFEGTSTETGNIEYVNGVANNGQYTGTVDIGSKVTLTAIPNENCELYAWKKIEANGKSTILSDKSEVLSVTAEAGVTYSALFYNASNDKYVAFKEGTTNYYLQSELASAVSNAVSGETIILIDNALLSENMTIGSGVTVLLPYALNKNEVNTSTSKSELNYANTHLAGSQTSYVGSTATPYLKMTIGNGVIVNVEGSLIVGGVLGSHGGLAGFTAGSHSNIVMRDQSAINVNGGKFSTCGYIVNDPTSTEGGKIVATSGGKVYQPLTIGDFHNGSFTAVIFKKHGLTPFSSFGMTNIQVPISLSSGADIMAYCYLYVSESNQVTTASFFVDDDESEGFIKYDKDAGSIDIKYNAKNAVINHFAGDTGYADITLNGECTVGSLKMTVMNGVDVDTAEIMFPISYWFNMRVTSESTLTFPKGIKSYMMPGAQLTVENNAKLILESGTKIDNSAQLAILDGGGIEHYAGYVYPYGSELKAQGYSERAKLIVNGELYVNDYATLAGWIETTDDRGILDISSKANLYKKVEDGLTQGDSYLVYNANNNTNYTYRDLDAKVISNVDGVLTETKLAGGIYYGSNNEYFDEDYTYYSKNSGATLSPKFKNRAGEDEAEVIRGRWETGYTITLVDEDGNEYLDDNSTKVAPGKSEAVTLTWSNVLKTGYTVANEAILKLPEAAKVLGLPSPLRNEAKIYTMSISNMPRMDLVYSFSRTADTYQVTFNTNGGTSVDHVNVTYDETYVSALASVTTTKPGYVFEGWYLDEDLKNKVVISGDNLTTVKTAGAHTLYANWTPSTDTKYKVEIRQENAEDGFDVIGTYERMGTTGEKVYVEEELCVAEEGFTFDDAQSSLEGSIAADGSLVLTVFFKRNTYAFTTMVDGSATHAANVRHGATIDKPADPSKEGHTFAGWYGSEDDAKNLINEIEFPVTMPMQALTYYAGWTVNEHELTFKVGDEEAYKVGCAYGETILLPEDITTIFQKEGHHIGAWSSNDAFIILGTSKMPDEDVIFTANWEVNKFNVHFHLNDGSEIVSNEYVYAYNDEQGLPDLENDLNFEWEHYDFQGWATTADGTVKYEEDYYNSTEHADDVLTTGTEDVHLYAIWEPHVYEIRYELNGGQLNEGDENPTEYIVSNEQYELLSPTKLGYTFEGWRTENGETVDKIDCSNGGNLVLTAVWEPISYTIAFDSNGADEGQMENMTLGYEDNVPLEKNAFHRIGYTFKGWSTSKTGEVEFDDEENIEKLTTTEDATVTLYAVWEVNTYNIVYKVDGEVKYTDELDYGKALTVRETETKEGYTFSGWSFSGLNEAPETMPAEDVEIVGTFTPNNYTVEFGGNGGVTKDDETEYTQEFTYDTAENLITNAFTKRGYSFEKWQLVKEGEEPRVFVNGEEVVNLATNGIVKLVAVWVANEYTLTYNANGGDAGSVPTVQDWTYDQAEKVVLSDKEPTRTGYTFLGWAETEDAVAKQYNPEQEIDSNQWADDTTLYAVWQINSYTVTYKVDGIEKHTDTVVYNEGIPEYADPEKTGYTFAGWTPAVPAKMPATNLVVEATWTANQYDVTFDSKGGLAVEDTKATYGSTYADVLPATNPIKTGYEFAGWYLDDKYETSPITSETEVSTAGDHTLYAKWTALPYEVTLNLNGGQFDGEGPENNKVIVYYDSKYSAVLYQYTLVKTGYDFVGWYFDTELNEAVGDTTLTNAYSHNLFAKWQAKTPTVTLNLAGGQLEDNVEATFEATFDKAYGKLPTPTRAGYQFDGWFLNDTEVTKDTIVKTETAHELVAKWTANTDTEYTVQYFYMDLNGNYSNTPRDTKTKTGTTDTTVTINKDNAEEVTGFTFDATMDEDLSGNIEGDGSLVLKVYYSRNTYTYTTVVDGVSTSKEYKYEEAVAPIADPQKTGYTFKGWYDNNKYDGEPLELVTKMPASDIIIYAKLDINQYTLKFDVNGGSEIADITQDFGTDVTVPADPTKTGYIFAGWYDGEEANSNKVNVVTIMPAENITYYAKWTAIKYNVVFDTNTGEGSTAPIVHTYDADDNKIASGVNFMKDGYTFNGWNTLANGNGDSYEEGNDNAGNLSSTEDATVTLYAQWKANEYDVIFNGNGSTSGTMDNQDFTYDVEQALSANKFEKTGYTFTGWAETSGGAAIYDNKATVKNLTAIPQGAKTLYAVWAPNQYEVTFNTMGGSNVGAKNATYESTYNGVLPDNNPTKDGYTFAGWYLTDDYSGDAVTVETIVKTAKDHTLYAKWTANSYTVKFDANKGTGDSMSNQTFIYDVAQKLTKNTYARTGYTFLGWSTDKDATTATYTDEQSVSKLTATKDGEVTLYAVWAEGQDTGYKVRHYLQNIENDEYTLDNIQELKGVTNHQTNAQAVQQTGFTAKEFEQKTIAADGTTVVDIYYTRNVNTVTWKWGLAGTEDITVKLKYGATVTVPEEFKTPVQEGYTFKQWNTIPQAMPDEEVTITGQWTINKHDITWYIDGEVAKTDSDVAYNTAITKYVPTSKTGYIFSGWFTDDELTSGNEVNEFGNMPDNDVPYYAKWTPIKYSVKFDVNTGNGTVDPITHTYDADNNVVASTDGISKTGYTFKEWNTQSNGSGQGYNAEATVGNLTDDDGETITLYAIWTPNTYKVEFIGNGSTSGEMSKQDFTYDEADNLTTNKFERTGYTFTGWSTTAGGEVEYTDGKSVSNLTAEDDKIVKLYAVWKANDNTTYTVKHNLQDVDGEGYTVRDAKVLTGTTDTMTQATANTYEGFTADTITQVNIDPDGNAVVNVYYTRKTYELTWNYTGDETKSETVDVKYGATIVLPSQPTKTGHSFAGWAGLVDKMPAENIILTSTWTINSYTIKWYLTDKTGTTTTKTDTYEYDSDVTTYIPADVDGYTFTGWHTDAKFEEDATVPSKMTAGNLEYHGKYEANKYTIKFDLNGGEGSIADQVFTYDKNEKLTSAVPTRTGYIFNNWAYGEDTYVPERDIYNLVTGGQVTFEAQWTPITYKVSFNDNGATGGEMTAQNFTYDVQQQLTANEFVKAGYTFKGWSTADDKTVEYEDSKAVENLTDVNNQTIELFAVWEANTYNVKFHGNGATYGTMADQEFVYNEDENLVANEFTKDGYHFVGWATSENSTDVAYEDGAKLNVATEANGVVNLYAVWELNKYTVKFESGLDGVEPVTQVFTNGVEQELTANGFNKAGYHFKEWAGSNGTSYADKQLVTLTNLESNVAITLTAVWEANDDTEYTVVYRFPKLGEEGYDVVTETYKGTTDTTVDAPFIEKLGFSAPEEVKKITIAADGKASVTYDYTRNTYKVTWNVDGKTTTSDFLYEQTIVAPTDPTKEGHEFSNWTDATGNALTAETTMPADNVTYTANWTVNKYDLTWMVDGKIHNTAKVEYGNTITLPTDPSKVGYTFAGWYSDEALENKVENFGTMPAVDTTYYAKWDANTDTPYIVKHYKYDLNGRDSVLADTEEFTGTTNTKVTPNVKDYVGFIAPEKREVTILADGTLVVEYYYTRDTFNVVWHKNNGLVPESVQRIFEQQIYKITDPTRDGYTFAGWYENETFEGNSITSFGKMPASDVAYYAKWTPITYGISYTMNGGSWSGETGPSSYTIESETFTLPNPTKTGYTFIGWTGSNGETPQKTVTIEKGTLDHKSYTANFEANTYEVVFNGNGATKGEMANQSLTYDADAVPLTTNAFEKEGHRFVGWSKNADGTGYIYADGEAVNNLTGGESITLYACWTANKYTITFDANKGSMDVNQISDLYGTTITAPTDPTRTGYIFAGWDPELPNTIPAKNMTLIAQWKPITYTVKFEAGEGTGTMNSVTYTYDEAKNLPVNKFEKEGYSFDGWKLEGSTDLLDNEQEILNLAKVQDSEIVLTAQWTINQYTITFDTAGGVAISPITQDFNTAVTDPGTPVREGYRFDGWVDENGDSAAVPTTMPASNKKFTATWTSYLELLHDIPTPDFEDALTDAEDEATLDIARSYYMLLNEDQIAKYKSEEKYKEHYETLFEVIKAVSERDLIKAVSDAQEPTNKELIDKEYGQVAELKLNDNQQVDAIILEPDCPAMNMLNLNFLIELFGYEEVNGVIINDSTECKEDNFDQINVMLAIAFETFGKAEGFEKIDEFADDLRLNKDKIFVSKLDGYTIKATLLATTPEGVNYTMDYYIDFFNEYHDVVWMYDSETEHDTVSTAFDSAIQLPEEPTKIGYTFDGWNTKTDGSGEDFVEGTLMGKKATTYYAQWKINQYTITFDTDGGSKVDSITANYNAYIGDDKPANPKKEGYTFTGWDAIDPAGHSDLIPDYMPAYNMTYKALWSINSHNLTFDANDGTFEDGKEAITEATEYNTTITLPKAPTRTGYTFLGWVDADGKDFVEGTTMPDKAVTYTAKWKIKQYTIKFFSNGEQIDSITADFDQYIANDKPADPYREGYTFTGWSVTVPDYMPAENMTITAGWSINSYDLTFNANGGAFAEDKEALTEETQYSATINLPEEPTRTGYDFVGWFENEEQTGEAVTFPVTMPASDKTYYAGWTANTYTVTLDTAGGYFDEDTPSVTVTYDKQFGLPTPKRTGYTFLGWYLDGNKINNTDLVKITEDVTVVAKWDVGESFTITYDLNEGKWATGTQVVNNFNVATPTFELKTPVREGYTFTGWTGSNGIIPETNVTIEKGTTGDLEYKANWKIKEFTITFETDGGTEINSITQNFGTDITAPADPTKTGYKFLGWDKAIPQTMPATDMTITAQWQINQYKLTFVTNGGSAVSNITDDYNASVTVPADPTREGYTFAGWYDNEELKGSPVAIPTNMPAGDKTYYAKWDINEYTITFNTNGGSKIDSITQDFATEITVPEDPTKTGYTFDGWYDNEKLEGEAVKIPTVMPAASKTYYAKWTINQYKITFETNEGSVVKNIIQDYDTDITAPADPTREGYTFAGWYDNEKLEGTPVEIPTKMPAANKTYYAKWTINQYKITFNTNGGSEIEELTFNYNESIVLDVETTREGYTFVAWYDNEKLEGEPAAIPAKMPAKDINLTAKWNINTYKVFYEVDGQLMYTDYVTYGNEIPLRGDQTKTGYTFSGWSEVPSKMPAKDITVTGSFTANNYKVNFIANYPAAEAIDSTTVTYGSAYGDLPTVTRTGYTFAGWYFDNAKITEESTVKTAKEHTLIAEWTPNTYKVNLDANGGQVSQDYVEVTYDETFGTLPTPKLDGYDFVGWFNGNEQITSETVVAITETITLKAHWNAAGDTPYKVEHYQQTLDGKYELVETEENLTGKTGSEVQAKQKTYTGFKANLDDSTAEGTIKADGTLVLKMYYDRESYTIVWNVANKEIRETYLYGQTLNVPDTTWADDIHTSHTFTGWDVELPKTAAANATYTAIYSADYEASIGDTTYRTLKLALANAKSGETVFLEKDITLTEDITVPTGVNLLVPCMDDDIGYVLVQNGRYKFNHDNPTTSSNPVLYRTLTVPEGVTVTVNGNILINSVSGRNSGGTAEMDVTGGYGQINLDGNIIVNNGGNLDCFGFIKGAGSVTAENGGTVGDLYIVRHWRGGSQALEMYQSIYEYGDPEKPDERQVYPMNEYDCHNIETDVIIKYGASYEGLVKMNANAGGGTAYYHTRFPQVDVDNGLIRLTTEDGYVVRSYDEASKEETYAIYGGANFAESSLVILGQNLSTKDFLFPIDGDINFVLNNGDYHFVNDYKFLPGGGMTVNKGATLTVDMGTYVAFYDEFHDVKNTGNTQYPEREACILTIKEGAKFINAGTFGGSIVTESPDILIGDYPTWGIETLEANGYTNGTVTYVHDLSITREGYEWRYGDISLGEVPKSIIWYGANYDALMAAVKSVPADLDIYSDETADPLEKVLGEIKYNLGKDQQAQVDEWTKQVTEGVANLKLRVVKVTFNAGGGTVSEPTRDVTYGEAFGTLPIPEYYGFKFLGWFDEDNMEVTETSVMKLKVNNLLLTARWEKLPADYTKVNEAIASIPEDMTGYTDESIKAVYDARDAVDMTLGLADQAKVDKMAQAILDAIDALERVKVTVSFDANGGEAITKTFEVRYGDNYPYSELPVPVRDGFDFIGWYTAKEGGSEITATSKVTSEKDVVLYAKWQAEAVTEPADYTVVEQAKAKIPADLKPYTAASVNKLNAAVEAVIPGLTIDRQGDVNAWAKAIEEAIEGLTYKTITVYLDPVDGECDTKSILVTYGTAVTELPSANKTYCDFLGWFTAKEGGEKVEAADLTYKTENLTIYAQYKLRDADYSRIEEIKAMIPEDLSGYSDESVARLDAALAQIEPGYTADKQTLVDRWADELYDAYTKLAYRTVVLTFDAQGGQVSPKTLEVQYKGTIQLIPTPERAYYTFAGWFTEPDGKGTEVKVGDEVTSTTDFSIYAKWEQHDADYSKVEAAIAKIPADVEKYYTEESVAKLQAALDEVEYGLHQGHQEKIDKWAGKIEVARQQLQGKKVRTVFDANGGFFEVSGGQYKTSSKEPRYGNNYQLPDTTPVRTGYTFAGWFTDPTGGEQITSSTVVKTVENHRIYARWAGGPADYSKVEVAKAKVPSNLTSGIYTAESVKRVQNAVKAVIYGLPVEEQAKVDAWAAEINAAVKALKKQGCTDSFISKDCPSDHFKDIDQKQWYHLGVDFVVSEGIMNGTSKTTFAPNLETTRGMIVTMLYRMSGEDVTKSELKAMKFKDVKSNDYYYEAVAWAASKGVVNGTSATTFDPNSNITREQMVSMLFRYSNYQGHDTDDRTSISKFADAKKVSSYATDAVKWASATGLLAGMQDSNGKMTIQPQGFTTRAQAATFIMRFCQHVEKTNELSELNEVSEVSELNE